jgi:26S proteasome regulatory subunit N7
VIIKHERVVEDSDSCIPRSLIEKGGDWDRRNRLKVYSAIHFLGIRKFKEAADLLLESLSTFTATEVMEYEEFVAMTIIATGVGCDRKGIKTRVCLIE